MVAGTPSPEVKLSPDSLAEYTGTDVTISSEVAVSSKFNNGGRGPSEGVEGVPLETGPSKFNSGGKAPREGVEVAPVETAEDGSGSSEGTSRCKPYEPIDLTTDAKVPSIIFKDLAYIETNREL